MARQPRNVVPGETLHVFQNSVADARCFGEDADKAFFLRQMRTLCQGQNFSLHAFVILSSGFHLLITPGDRTSLSRYMQRLTQRYTQYVNRRSGRRGTLWAGRYHSQRLEDGPQVLECQKRIEALPVESEGVRHPAQYPWSSYGVHGHGVSQDFLVAHAAYLALGSDLGSRCSTYRRFFLSYLSRHPQAPHAGQAAEGPV